MKRGELHWKRGDKPLGKTVTGFARSFALRLRGLLGRPPLAPGEGLLIEPCNAVHTFFMGYSIDVVFISAQHKVLALRSEVMPWRARQCLRAHYVVELAAGEINRLGLEVGDLCQWQ